jgi:putative transposase
MAYRSNNNVVFRCLFHVMWCPKYRRPVLVDDVAERLKAIIRDVAHERRALSEALEVRPDHGHLMVDSAPQYGVHRLVRQEYPTLRSRLPTLWTHSYGVLTVGGAPLSVLTQYVENQKRG